VHLLEMLIDWARERPGQRRILLFIDEYERLLEEDAFPLRDGLEILTYLRGVVQHYPGTFNFLIAGRSRNLAFRPSFDSRQNPLLNLLVDFPLAGLKQQEMNTLISKLGRRLSLKFERSALDVIWEETGGHPFLAREFGRLLDQKTPSKNRDPHAKSITHDDIARLKNHFHRHVETTLSEIKEAIVGLHPDVLFALSYVQLCPQEAGDALASLPSAVIDELCRFGILQEQQAGWKIRIGCFGEWVGQSYDSSLPSLAHG
jgi:hypothetical protein